MDERTEHDLTLRRTLAGVGWALAVGWLLIAGAAVATDGASTSAVTAATLGLVWAAVGGALAAIPVAALALFALRRTGSGRAPRIVVGALAGAVIGVTQAAVLAHRSPWALAGSDPGLALIMLVVPVLAGAVAGAVVGPRPPARARAVGSDESAEDALLDGR